MVPRSEDQLNEKKEKLETGFQEKICLAQNLIPD